MTYGLSTSAFIEDGPEVQAMRSRSSYSTARSWRALTAERVAREGDPEWRDDIPVLLVDEARKPA